MTDTASFTDLGLSAPILQSLDKIGYENPSPIQAQCIPPLLDGHDVLGQAQTGTGKTAAFALPLLSRLDLSLNQPQALILTPTRELALQVSEAIQNYGQFLSPFYALPIYGGQAYDKQLRPLKRGVHVVIGTPGRVMDHMRRGSLNTEHLKTLVLDEADEMLRMGFIEDVEWVLNQLPQQRQIALFSATMPEAIRRITRSYQTDPMHVTVASQTKTASTIRQRFLDTRGIDKLEALTRLLESENTDGTIVFVRTKNATLELSDRLNARGFVAHALNGDIPQAQRERVVDQFKEERFDVLVATDVVARGLDVPRISHVINYDIPHDSESYVHRIGRTGRAGRSGEAILMVTPREHRLLRSIERSTQQPIEPMSLPSLDDINEKRALAFKQRIVERLSNEHQNGLLYRLINDIERDSNASPTDIAVALATLINDKEPILLSSSKSDRRQKSAASDNSTQGRQRKESTPRYEVKELSYDALPLRDFPEVDMQRFRLAVGHRHGVNPGQIVGAIANEADIESRYIGHIGIHEEFSTVDLPADMPKEIFQHLKKTRVCQQALSISLLTPKQPTASSPATKPKARANSKKKPRKPRSKKR